MPWLRPRYRLRTLLVLVALAALVLGFGRWRVHRRARAAYHAAMEARYRAIDVAALDGAMCRRKEIEHHSRLRLEYERPWWSWRAVRPTSCGHPRS
jgi:hypothetical protein